ncbi:hypothetical protein QUB60_20190 [Microcoleus sp. A2-C5]|uniref:hypothetical protein n=1 Tax=unclassified Microcoleus TaxID=2642155 RepID=UPI002FD750F0
MRFILTRQAGTCCGIVGCTRNNGIGRLTANMNDAISTAETLRGKLIRVDRTVAAIYILSRSPHRKAKQSQPENHCIGLIAGYNPSPIFPAEKNLRPD